MRKIALAMLALFISINVYAANTADTSNTLGSAINKSMQNRSGSTQDSGVIYGGKDIVRSMAVSG